MILRNGEIMGSVEIIDLRKSIEHQNRILLEMLEEMRRMNENFERMLLEAKE